MIFNLDTSHYETTKIFLTDKECDAAIPELIEEFCFAIASFFLDFAVKLDCDKKQGDELKDIVLDCTGDIIEHLLENDLLKPSEDESPEEETDTQTEETENAGFTEADIANIVQLIEDCGGLASTKEFLRQYAAEKGIDIEGFYCDEYED